MTNHVRHRSEHAGVGRRTIQVDEPRDSAHYFLIAASQFCISTARASSPGGSSALRVISNRPSAASSNDINDTPRAESSTRTTDGAPMVSGFIASARGRAQWTLDDLAPVVNHTLDAFGPDRVMFGGDWPVCLLASSYAGWHELVASVYRGLSVDEQARVFGGTAVEVYGL